MGAILYYSCCVRIDAPGSSRGAKGEMTDAKAKASKDCGRSQRIRPLPACTQTKRKRCLHRCVQGEEMFGRCGVQKTPKEKMAFPPRAMGRGGQRWTGSLRPGLRIPVL